MTNRAPRRSSVRRSRRANGIIAGERGRYQGDKGRRRAAPASEGIDPRRRVATRADGADQRGAHRSSASGCGSTTFFRALSARGRRATRRSNVERDGPSNLEGATGAHDGIGDDRIACARCRRVRVNSRRLSPPHQQLRRGPTGCSTSGRGPHGTGPDAPPFEALTRAQARDELIMQLVPHVGAGSRGEDVQRRGES